MVRRLWIAATVSSLVAFGNGCELIAHFDPSLLDGSGDGGDAVSADAITSTDTPSPDASVDAADAVHMGDANDGTPPEVAADASDANDAGSADASAESGIDSGADTSVDAGSDAGSEAASTSDVIDGSTLLANGSTCSDGTQCQSDACVGTLCCATTCTDTGAAACGTNGQCLADGSACQTYSSSTVCRLASCTSGQATPAANCDGAGNCGSPASQSCAPNLCNAAGTACAGNCASDTDCVTSTSYCDTASGHCLALLGSGGACTGNDQCQSGVCGTSGSGNCCPIACNPSGGPCGATGCDTTGACTFPDSSVQCGTSCSGSTLTSLACNSAGACGASVGSSACPGNVLCVSTTSCLGGCGSNSAAGDANCISGYCDGVGAGSCVAGQGPGGTCARASQCQDLLCSNGVCDQCTDYLRDGDETDVDCGGATCGACANTGGCLVNGDCKSANCVSLVCVQASLLMIGADATGSLGAELHPSTLGTGTWSSPAALGAPTDSDVGIAFASNGSSPSAVGVMRYFNGSNGSDPLNEDLMYVTWSPTGFTSWASVGSTVTTRQVPGIFGAGGTAFVSFQGLDFEQYYLSWTGTSWSAVENISSVSGLPTPPAIAAVGGQPSVVYFGPGPANNPTEQDRAASWAGTPTTLGTASNYAATPSLITMNGGPADLMTVYLAQDTTTFGTGALTFNTRSASGGVWSSAATITGAVAAESASFGPVAHLGLAELPNGDAIVAWVDDTTGGLMYALYNGSTWSAPAPFAATNNPTPSAAPALTHGAAGATAEMAYVDGAGNAWHARWNGTSWSTPVQVMTGVSHVALAVSP